MVQWTPFIDQWGPGSSTSIQNLKSLSGARRPGGDQQSPSTRDNGSRGTAFDAEGTHIGFLDNEECGEWFWEGPYAAKDRRILPTQTGEEELPECGATFKLENVTGLPGVSDYSLELDTRAENASVEWVLPYPEDVAGGGVFLIPTLGLDLNVAPIDSSQPATVSIRGSMSVSSLGPDLGLYILRNILSLASLTGNPLFCAVPVERLYLSALKTYYSGIFDQALELLIDFKIADAWQQLNLTFDDFSLQLLIEADLDCSIEALSLILGAVVIKTKLLLAAIVYSVTVINDYRKFGGRPSETLLRYYPSSESEVAPTEVVFFEPQGFSGQEHSGECWTIAIAAPRQGAWRCMTDIGIYDPCFEYDDEASAVICGATPWDPRAGFKLNLTSPLPEFTELDLISAWVFELEDGAICYVLSTGTTVFTQIDEAIIYGCDDGWVIIGWPTIDRVWTAEKARLSSDNSKVEETVMVSIRKVWR